MITTEKIVTLLNELLADDPAAVDAGMQLCVPCNATVRDHPTVQVMCKNAEGDMPVVRLLGLLNGVAAMDGHLIFADYDPETRTLLRFRAAAME